MCEAAVGRGLEPLLPRCRGSSKNDSDCIHRSNALVKLRELPDGKIANVAAWRLAGCALPENPGELVEREADRQCRAHDTDPVNRFGRISPIPTGIANDVG